ncbi:hypothetical protein AB870_22880 [Pandoraea faecigallinarum]|uniref:D-alanine--D-alanine ligase n=2 Tax=Pandoraea faecigallinarum TaxID=656179 RepID=A0A0H3WVU8_9BURK|nr:hypothetical protein AB870_22880 [Pandoraea faecigallinarum]
MEVAGNDDFPIFLAAQYIHGKDLSVGIVEIERQPVVLPLLETKHDDQFYSYEVKSGKSPHLHICPAEVSDSVEIEIKNQALAIYQELGCRGFARVDFILSNEKPWFLEVNTIPGLSRNGNLSQMGAAFGWTYEDMIFHLISTIDDSFKYKP